MPNTPLHSPGRRAIRGRGTEESVWSDSPRLAGLATMPIDDWVSRFERIWVLAPHPDDQVLALGGSLAQLSALGADVRIVAITDGEGSPAGGPEWTPERLAVERPAEVLRGLDALEVRADVHRMQLPDGQIGAHRQALLRHLVEQIGENDLILATCRIDGHADHEACGDVAMIAAELTGAVLFEYPVWLWHWARPDEVLVPWNRASRIAIPAETLARKHCAIRHLTTQITAHGRQAAALPAHVLQRFLRPFEVVFAA